MHKMKIRWDQSLFALLAGFFFLFLFSSSVLASPEELSAVNQQIQNSGARWQAAETSISQLPSDQRRMRLGFTKGSFSVPAGAAASSSTSATGGPTKTPPATLDYNVPASGNTYGYVTPIRDQGNCGSCWAFGTTAALESQYLMSTNGAGWSNLTPTVLYDGLYNGGLSEQILLSCSNAGNCEVGGDPDQASQFIQSTGLPLASCFLYTATDNTCSNASCPFWQSQTYSITGWVYVSPQTAPTAAALESYLTTYGPLVTTMNVYTDFFYYVGGIYSYLGPVKLSNGKQNVFEGGHVIEIIGYNHASQYFIVKNSWGTGWGTSDANGGSVTTPGFFLIAYSQLAQMTRAQTGDNYGGPEFGWYSIAYTGYSPDPCTYSLSSSSASATYSGGNASVSVTSPSGCSWTAASNASWISILSGKKGKGNGTVTYSVTANNANTSRQGTLTIAGKTFTVTQAAESCSNASISPQSASPTYNGGNATVTVTSPSGCPWTAVSNVSWISITSGASGSGNGTVKYSVSANTLGTSRVGTLTIAGQTLTVTQAAAPCTYSLSASSASPTYTGGSATVNVTSLSGCSWTAVSNASWISVVSGRSGTGSGTVTYSVAANNADTSRIGTLTIAGQTFTVTQGAAPCTYSLSATSASPAYTGGSATVNVTSPSGCPWTAVSNNTSFISVVSGASGTGNGTVTYSVSANNAGTSRQGTLTIAGKTFTVTQAGVPPCSYTLSSKSASPSYIGGNASVNVTSPTGCSWTAASNVIWISIVSGASGTGNGTVKYSVSTNTSIASRTGTLTIGGQTFTVTQGGRIIF